MDEVADSCGQRCRGPVCPAPSGAHVWPIPWRLRVMSSVRQTLLANGRLRKRGILRQERLPGCVLCVAEETSPAVGKSIVCAGSFGTDSLQSLPDEYGQCSDYKALHCRTAKPGTACCFCCLCLFVGRCEWLSRSHARGHRRGECPHEGEPKQDAAVVQVWFWRCGA